MIVRMNPSNCQVNELYKYSHLIEERQNIYFREAKALVSISYQYDGHKFSDLKTAKERASDEVINELSVGFASIKYQSNGSSKIAKPRKAHSIRIPAQNLFKKLARNDTCTKQFNYILDELKWLPLRIEAEIVDESPHASETIEYFEAHEFSEHLNLNLNFHVNIPVELLRNSLIMNRKLRQILSGEEKTKLLYIYPSDDSDQANISMSIAALANENGGVITFGVNSQNEIVGMDENKIDDFLRAIETAALSLDPPIPVQPYQLLTPDNKNVLLVEIPGKLSHLCKYEGKYYIESNGVVIAIDEEITINHSILDFDNRRKPYIYPEESINKPVSLSETEAELMVRKGSNKSIYFIHRDIGALPEIQAAIANSGGGHIFFGVKRANPEQPGEILGFAEDEIEKLKIKIHSEKHRNIPLTKPYKLQIENKNILVQYIPTNLPDIFRFNNKFPRYDGERIQNLDNKEAMDILREKKGKILELIFTTPRPIIRRLALEWIEFPLNQEFNPETGCLEWRNLSMEEDKKKVGYFTSALSISLNRAKELFERKKIVGEVEIEIEDVLLSNTSLEFYNALGYPEKVNWDGLTKLKSELTLYLPDILQRRSYFPWRSISIIGIEPTLARVHDIIRAFNDSGIVTEKTFYRGYSRSLKEGIEIQGRRRGQHGITQILCIIKGKQSQVKRELRTGHRTDNKELISGIIEIEFSASTEDSHIEVMRLLNEVTDNIKHRFNYLRVE